MLNTISQIGPLSNLKIGMSVLRVRLEKMMMLENHPAAK
jgi:hypothetical protein